MSVFELLAQIRDDAHLAEVPVVVHGGIRGG
jgi:hypothetical protein